MLSQPEDELEIRVASVRALHEWLDRPTGIVHLSVSSDPAGRTLPFEDPNDELLLALCEHDIDARPLSQSKQVNGFYIDPTSGAQTYLLGIQRVQMIGLTDALASVLYMKGIRCGSTFTYEFEYGGGNWVVVKEKLTGMS